MSKSGQRIKVDSLILPDLISDFAPAFCFWDLNNPLRVHFEFPESSLLLELSLGKEHGTCEADCKEVHRGEST